MGDHYSELGIPGSTKSLKLKSYHLDLSTSSVLSFHVEFFFVHQDYYCATCYQSNFGTMCYACKKFVEGEVVTALGKTYHQVCASLSRCVLDTISPGAKYKTLIS